MSYGRGSRAALTAVILGQNPQKGSEILGVSPRNDPNNIIGQGFWTAEILGQTPQRGPILGIGQNRVSWTAAILGEEGPQSGGESLGENRNQIVMPTTNMHSQNWVATTAKQNLKHSPNGMKKSVQKKGVDLSDSRQKTQVKEPTPPIIKGPTKLCKKQVRESPQENLRTRMQTENHMTNVKSTPMAKDPIHAMNLFARNFLMKNSVSGKDREPDGQMVKVDDKRGIKRPSLDQINPRNLNAMESLYMLEIHKKMKMQNGFCTPRPEDNSREEPRRPKAIDGNILASQLLNAHVGRVKSTYQANRPHSQRPVAVAWSFKKQSGSSAMQPITERSTQGCGTNSLTAWPLRRDEMHKSRNDANSVTAMVWWNRPPVTPLKDNSRSAMVSYTSTLVEKKKTGTFSQRSNEADKMTSDKPKDDSEVQQISFKNAMISYRRVFRGRADSFIARMHIVLGDRRFSRLKGPMVDPVIVLTQNVSDHLSSSASMSLGAKLLLKSTSTDEIPSQHATCVLVEKPTEAVLPNDTMITHNLEAEDQIVGLETSKEPSPVTQLERSQYMHHLLNRAKQIVMPTTDTHSKGSHVIPVKPIPQRSHVVTVNEAGNEIWEDFVGMYNVLLEERTLNLNEVAQDYYQDRENQNQVATTAKATLGTEHNGSTCFKI